MEVGGTLCKCLFICILSVVISYTLADVLSYGKCRDCLRFPSNGTAISRVENILIDETNKRLIAGATNAVFSLELNNLTLPSPQDFVALKPSQEALQTCLNGGLSQVRCQNNYIKILLFDTVPGRIFACGTYATRTRCWRFQGANNLNPMPPDGINGKGISPVSYDQNVTGTFTDDHLFTGINLHDGTGNSVIYRTTANASTGVYLTSLETVLQDANFVSSFHYSDNFVYFFLRETAVEMNKQIVYSRVARVCQYDEGGDLGVLKNKFTSFVKTRVSCSVPGNIPFDFDEIQAAIKATDPKTNDDYIYGIFTTPDLVGIPSSAVCRYSMKSLVKLFDDSQYLEDKSERQRGPPCWQPVSPVNLSKVPSRPKCDKNLDTKSYSLDSIVFAELHPLLAETLTSSRQTPLFTRAQTRFTGIVVDYVKDGSGAVIPVMFVATDNGTVFKVFNNVSGDYNPVILEQIQVFEKPDPIYTIKLFERAVYIGSSSNVVKVPVEHCNRYLSCRTCVSSLDPYCGWNNNKCTTFEEKEGSYWAQDIVQGNFSKVCLEEPPTCSVIVTRELVGGITSLSCQGERGVPLPTITKWTKDSELVTGHSDYNVLPGRSSDQGELEISNFGISHVGVYRCFVANKMGNSSCAINIRGILPVIASALIKVNQTSLFVCNATGLPTPRVSIYKLIGETKYVINSHQTQIGADSGQRSYFCVAENEFGSSFGETVHIEDKQVKADLRLTNEQWSSSLSDEKSQEFISLTGRIKNVVREIYSKNPAFIGFKDISFSKGSIICAMVLNFAAEPASKNSELLEDLQERVSSGKVGQFSVDASHGLNVEPEVDPTPAPDKQENRDNGLFAVAVVTAILLSLILGFALGVKFHGQVMSHCKGSSEDPESCDGPSNKKVEGVKYTRSPPRDEKSKSEPNTTKRLLNKERDETGEAEGSDSDSSTAGKIGNEDDGNNTFSRSPARSISPTVSITRNDKKPPLRNGKMSVC
ncbi:Semaphorin-5A [Porites harrisoni]